MNQWRVILATAVIFCAGVVTGASVVNIQQKKAPRQPAAPRLPLPPFPFNTVQKREYLGRLDRHLNLTQEQYESIEEILHDGNDHIRAVWEPIAPKMRDELKKMRERIRAELTPEQVKKFEQETPKIRKALKGESSENMKPREGARAAKGANTGATKPGTAEGTFIELVPAPASTKPAQQ